MNLVLRQKKMGKMPWWWSLIACPTFYVLVLYTLFFMLRVADFLGRWPGLWVVVFQRCLSVCGGVKHPSFPSSGFHFFLQIHCPFHTTPIFEFLVVWRGQCREAGLFSWCQKAGLLPRCLVGLQWHWYKAIVRSSVSMLLCVTPPLSLGLGLLLFQRLRLRVSQGPTPGNLILYEPLPSRPPHFWQGF